MALSTRSLPVRRAQVSAFGVVNGVVLSLVAAACLFPMVHMVAVSFSTRARVLAGEVVFWPIGFNTASYAWVLLQGGFWTSLWVSAQRMVVGISVNVVLVLLLAYPLSKERHEFPPAPCTCGSSSSPCCSRLIYANHPDRYPVQTYLQILLRGDILSQATSLSEISEIFHLSNRTVRSAYIVIGIVPILALYPFLQRYFIKGIVIGSVKG